MKKIYAVLLLLTSVSTVFAVQKNYNVTIEVKGISNDIGILAYYYGDKRLIQDTVKFDAKGIGKIQGKKEIPAGVYLLAFPKLKYQSFDIILKEPEFSITTDTLDLVNHAFVKNSVENKQMFDDMKYMLPLGKQNDSIYKANKDLKKGDLKYNEYVKVSEKINEQMLTHRKEMIKKYPNTFYSKLIKLMLDTDVPEAPKKQDGTIDSTFKYTYTKQHYFDHLDYNDSGMVRSPVLGGKITRYFDNYVYPHPDSITQEIDKFLAKTRNNRELFMFTLNTLFMKYAKSEIMGQDAVFVDMAEKYYLSGVAWWPDPKGLAELQQQVSDLKPTLIGNNAPEFNVQDTLNINYSFHKFAKQNKYTILVFWNSDCGHCQKEIPHLKQLYLDSLKEMGIRVFAVSTEQVDSTFRNFAAKNCASDWVTCADMRGMSAFRKEYDVKSTPKLFLIDNNFRILAKNIPMENLVDFVKFEDNFRKKKEQEIKGEER